MKARARRAGILGWRGAALKVAVQSAPEQGRANAELLSLIATVLRLPAQQVSLVTGATSPDKRLGITGLDVAEIRLRIDSALAGE